MEALGLYRRARALGLRPALLESLGPRTAFGRRTLLGLQPTRCLEVWDGVLYEDGRPVGTALSLLERLEEGLGAGYFPAWVGFFAYEFARHFGLPARAPMPGLPEAAFCYYPEGYVWEDDRLVEAPRAPLEPDPGAPRALPGVRLVSDYPREAFIAGVRAVQERIRAGWVYQVNLSHRFRFPAAGLDPLDYYAALRRTNPSPFMGLVEGAGWAVVSGSPERLFVLRDGVISARPIAGTRRRGRTPEEDRALEAELRASVKERAEHVMLVDLLRNDLSRVAEPGTVEVSEAFTVERYSHVMHLVSEVRGASRSGVGAALRAVFPGGTITGAPKESVMRTIAELEPVPRGAYTGSLGYVSGRGADFNILIRSLTLAGGWAYLSAGAGIVIESDPVREYEETRHKAEALLHVLGQGRAGVPPAPPRVVEAWRPPRPRRRYAARVVFLENHDSFSYNLVNYLRMLGAEVRVVDHGEPPEFGGATHLVVGPGPGDPFTAGRTLEWVRAALEDGVPFLGVCLGHQALGVALGGVLERAPRPVHGEAHPVRHVGRGVFAGLPDPAPFTRYHSLHLRALPPVLERLAWTEDGVVMGVGHRSRPAWGVQFHPESMLSPYGLELLANFLEVDRAAAGR